MMKHLILSFLVSFTSATYLAGCATVPTDYSFNSADEKALLVLAMPKTAILTGYELTPVDMQAEQFVGKPIKIVVNAMDVNRSIGDSESTTYGVMKVTPGAYAITSFYQQEGTALGTTGVSKCFHDGAPVFELKSGLVSVIPVAGAARELSRTISVVSSEEALSGYRALAPNFPGISGKATAPMQTSTITFEDKKPTFTKRACPAPNQSFDIEQ